MGFGAVVEEGGEEGEEGRREVVVGLRGGGGWRLLASLEFEFLLSSGDGLADPPHGCGFGLEHALLGPQGPPHGKGRQDEVEGVAVGKADFVNPLGEDRRDRLDLFDGRVRGNGLAEHGPDGLGGWRLAHGWFVSKVFSLSLSRGSFGRVGKNAASPSARPRVFWVLRGETGLCPSRLISNEFVRRDLIEMAQLLAGCL